MNKNLKVIKIFGLDVSCVDYPDLIQLINCSISENKQVAITGVNVNSLNLVYSSKENYNIFSNFEILHPDGFGIYFASKVLYKEEFKNRITGSDFYPILIHEIIVKNWKVFFLGDLDSTLTKVKVINSQMRIVGMQNGFDYETDSIVKVINQSNADILVVGMGSPKQECWINENRKSIRVNVLISVGEGIRVFADSKIRGYKFVQKLGFEWLARLINNPKMYWKRYLIGIPLFVFRFIYIEVIKKHV